VFAEMLSWWTTTCTTTLLILGLPFPFSSNERMPTIVPRYFYLNLSIHVMHNVSRLRLWAHTLKVQVEAAAWLKDGSRVSDRGKMNMLRTRCMLFYFAKTIMFVS
jgi:hypothetical protein